MHELDVRTAPADRLADAIDARTTAVAFSVVQSATGAVAPIVEADVDAALDALT